MEDCRYLARKNSVSEKIWYCANSKQYCIEGLLRNGYHHIKCPEYKRRVEIPEELFKVE
jgi:hypothetical protein